MADREEGTIGISAARPLGGMSVTLTVVVCALFVFVLARSVDPMTSAHPAFKAGGDHTHYIDMAREPGGTHRAPFSFRVLMPALARRMPFGLADSFYFLTVIFIVGAGAAVYFLALAAPSGPSGGQRPALAAIALFYSISAGAKFCLYDFWLSEPPLFFLVTLSLYLLVRRRDIWLSIVLAAAVLSKESALFLIPAVYTMRARKVLDGPAALRTLAVGLLPVAVFIALRVSIPSVSRPGPAELFMTFGLPRLTGGLAGFIRGGTVGTWGVLIPVLIIASGREGGRFLLRMLPFLILVYMQPLFAGNVDRLLVLAFPVFVCTAVHGLDNLRRRFGLERWVCAGFVLIPFVLTALKDGYHPPSPEQQLLALSLWTAVAAARRIRGSKR